MSSSMLMDKLNSTAKSEGPSYVLEFNEQILDLVFSPFEWSHEVICIAFKDKITIGTVKFQEEHEEDQLEEVEFECVQEFPLSMRVHALAVSPETTLKDVPKSLVFAVSLSDFTLNLYNSSVSDAYTHKRWWIICPTKDPDILHREKAKIKCTKPTFRRGKTVTVFSLLEKKYTSEQQAFIDGTAGLLILTGHNSYVNSVSYEPAGYFLASASDDLTCRVWSIKHRSEESFKFYLESPGMEVCWHPVESGKLLVAEKSGTIRMYNTSSQTAVLSLRTDLGPLVSMDLAPTNSLHVAALCGEYLVIWEATSPSSPSVVRLVHPQGGRKVRFSTLTEKKVVTLGSPDNSLKLFTVGKQYPTTIANLMIAYGLSWHHHLPYVAVGVDRNIFLWKIQ